ncbi:portal protein [Variovorax sp. PAMC 28711]|uniref:portal protein n=1 Tax=Variovorax sp. PAMC 28711 TaxID=1795631 RepID=UPI00078BFC46|nr:hypothetical protein [Variovorax sp. PAMC 28711]AMM23000.1 hypothetical protein AX767_00345 [Variovorax sp. PAMC 28711]
MDDVTLLSLLQTQEDSSAQFLGNTLAQERRQSLKEFYRAPYGNEEEGWSSIVTSEVQDTVEWILPDLLDMFLSTPDAVEFEPTEEGEAKGAEEATQAVNHVFHKHNNGFLILYTAFKDALTVKNCAVHWRKETVRTLRRIPVQSASPEMLTMLVQDDDEIVAANQVQQPMIDPATGQAVIGVDGQPVMQTIINATISRPEERQRIRVEAFDPNDLLVQSGWTTPILDECPYVARSMEVTWSELKEMGLVVKVDGEMLEPEDLAASNQPNPGENDDDMRADRRGISDEPAQNRNEVDRDDESLTRGFLRIEWVLVDYDGDGVAERREIYRLADKILSNEECEEVPIATGSPILVPHRWDGMSVAEIMSDLQMLKTEMTRAVVNNATLANNPRQTVLQDSNGAPLADIDDLLDGRPGGLVRIKQIGALGADATPFIGGQALSVLEYFDQMGEKRTGVSKMQQGIDPNALRTDRTAYEAGQLNNAAKSRIKLIARVMAETVLKPIFRGILRLLTSGDMDPITFRLGDQFLKLDPNEWTDQYLLTTNVGLGTGDAEKQIMGLAKITQMQMGMATGPMGEMFVTPEQIYKSQAKMIQLLGFKNVGDFIKDPGPQAQLPKPPPPQPDPTAMAVAQLKTQADMKKAEFGMQQDAQKTAFQQRIEERRQENEATLQATNDARDAQREEAAAARAHELELARIAAEDQINIRDNRTRVITARIAHPEGLPSGIDIDPVTGMPYEQADPIAPVMDALAALTSHITAPRILVRDPTTGAPVGVQQGNMTQTIQRDDAGNITGAA